MCHCKIAYALQQLIERTVMFNTFKHCLVHRGVAFLSCAANICSYCCKKGQWHSQKTTLHKLHTAQGGCYSNMIELASQSPSKAHVPSSLTPSLVRPPRLALSTTHVLPMSFMSLTRKGINSLCCYTYSWRLAWFAVVTMLPDELLLNLLVRRWICYRHIAQGSLQDNQPQCVLSNRRTTDLCRVRHRPSRQQIKQRQEGGRHFRVNARCS